MKILTLSFASLLFLSLNAFAHPFTPCDEETGMADFYPCKKIDLLSRVHIDHMGGTASSSGSDIWGWTDPDTGKEYALMTLDFGTSFVDISTPTEPVYLGTLNTATTSTIWRDVKTYQNYAYIVSEANNHGMQIFDLTQLRNVQNPPVQFTSTNRYTGFGNAHNIIINEETGFAYAVGTQTCGEGLHMMNLADPVNPTRAGCYRQDGYTHDAQCVVYIGPDSEHNGKEICFNSNEDTVTIVDVSNKSTPQLISRTGYSNSQYTHQGWLTEDQRYFLMNDELDELDEQTLNHNTKTYIWDMLDLDAPRIIGFYNGPEKSIDHNLYIKGNHAYLTNYTSGLSIVDITDIGNANLNEVANFDTYAPNNSANFDGAWSNYPYFASGTVIVSDFQSGLFILNPKICPSSTPVQNVAVEAVADNSININWTQDLNGSESYSIYRSEGGCEANNFNKIAENITANEYTDNSVTGNVLVGYKVSKSDNSSQCVFETSSCVETQTTGICTAAPKFAGLVSVQSSNTSNCGLDLQWESATSYCQSNVSYDIYKSTDSAFIADDSTRIAYDIQTSADGGVVEITTDNNLWRSPMLNPDYPTQFNFSNDACSYGPETPSFSGEDLTWKKHTMDLSKYQGQDIKVRWNYSTNENTAKEGWYLDDLQITHTQTAAACTTIVEPPIQAGLWFDKAKDGHGFAIEPVGRDNLYYTLFYTYKDDGTPEWYSSLSTLENGILNMNSNSDTLLRSNYDFSVDPTDGNPILIDNSIGTNILSIDFNSENAEKSDACNDGENRGQKLALASWQLGEQQGTWCIAPNISIANTPVPDFGGTWWGGITDEGWGLSLAFLNDTLVTIIYFYDADGKPRWVIGQQNGFVIGQESTIELSQIEGYPRNDQKIPTNSLSAGTLNITLNSNSQNNDNGGQLTLDVTYLGSQGGSWIRKNTPISLFTQPH